ncbi:hypothetical protein T4D_10922 [Trichinella pseudospiralis]|uniref:Uncharacterized protein n=1 Tax=Trichinella pseudospiralis TaxID=6337 RepID=A0A0V1F6Y6_TRIPS|nr:hypothetical protein T4D_10922 [Trichinella pseudospiralis]
MVNKTWVGSFPVEKSSPDVNPIQVTNEHKIELKKKMRMNDILSRQENLHSLFAANKKAEI